MLLVLGDSFASHLRTRHPPDGIVRAVGRRSACLHDDVFRRWAVSVAADLRPQGLLLIVGGNDLACPAFEQRRLLRNFEGLTLGLLAAGVERVYVLLIPPRSGVRPGDVSAARFRRRRKFANIVLKHKFRRLPVVCPRVSFGAAFLGRDCVPPSASGWRDLDRIVQQCAAG